jgi:polysaccharide transporter, PST family
LTRVQALSGAALTATSQICLIALKLVSNICLARLLTPSDFGLIAMVAACVALTTTVQDFGLSFVLIYRERITQPQMSALFWLSVGFNLVIALITVACAPLIAWFFSEQRLVALTIAFGFLIFINGSGTISPAVLVREARFKALAAVDIITAIVGTIVGIAVAWRTSSYWSIFAAALASSIFGFVLNWTLSGFRLSWPSFQGSFKEIINFSTRISGFNIVGYFARNADNLLVGRFYGAYQLGFYDRAYQVLSFPLSQLHASLGRVVLPMLSRLRSNPDQYREAYLEVMSVFMTAIQPGLIFGIAFAEDLFSIVFGQQWIPAAPIFRWLALAGLVQTSISTMGGLFLSQGRGSDYFKIGAFNGMITVVSFVFGLPWGPPGVALSYCIANYIIIFPVTTWSVGRQGPVKSGDIINAALPHAIAIAVDGIAFAGLAFLVLSPGLFDCFGLVCVSYLTYGFVLLAFPKKRIIYKNNLRAMLKILL